MYNDNHRVNQNSVGCRVNKGILKLANPTVHVTTFTLTTHAVFVCPVPVESSDKLKPKTLSRCPLLRFANLRACSLSIDDGALLMPLTNTNTIISPADTNEPPFSPKLLATFRARTSTFVVGKKAKVCSVQSAAMAAIMVRMYLHNDLRHKYGDHISYCCTHGGARSQE